MDNIIVADEEMTFDKGEVLDLFGKGTTRVMADELAVSTGALNALIGSGEAVQRRVLPA